MLKCKITIVKKVWHKDLSSLYENHLDNPCEYNVGDVFYSDNGLIPPHFCPEAWKSVAPFVEYLASGKEDIFNGWMKNKRSALVSCNDGFRPVSFLIEVVDD